MPYSYRIVDDEKPEPVWPQRVKTLFASYEKASKELSKKVGRKIEIQYSPETEDLREMVFDRMVREKPDSLKVSIYRIYRVKKSQIDGGGEFYYYGCTKVCKNARGDLGEPWSYDRVGYHLDPVITMQYDEAMVEQKPRITGWESAYEYPWNAKEVKKLLDSSYLPCEQFYVGKAGKREPIDDRYYTINNKQDFLEGSFDDLMSMGRYGISYDHPSLELVEPARKQEKENRQKQVGMKVANPTAATTAYG